VVIAVGISTVLMATLAAQAVVARSTCDNHPLLVNVAVSADISPAIQRVGQLFNRENHAVDGRCVEVQVTQEAPAAVVSTVDGQGSSGGMPAFDAWIPDSSLWVDVARTYPVGAQQVQPTNVTVARSPLMIVMPSAAAVQIPAFNNSVGWNFLLPTAVGGPMSSEPVKVELPDPTQSSAGLATMVELGRLLGNGATARTRLTKFVFAATSSAQFDDPDSLADFNSLAKLSGYPVTVTSEQAVLGYDGVHPDHPLAARYPSGRSAALGTPELNYPYVLTTTNAAEQAAANQFGQALQDSYTAALVRYYGFRSANGVPGATPASYGLAQQPLRLATPAAPSEAQTALQAWQRLQRGARDLVLTDVSSAMETPAGPGGTTLWQETKQVAILGLGLFPDSTQMGMWEFANKLNGSLPYKQLVSVGPLPADYGLISRRQQLQQIDESLNPMSDTQASLYQTILTAYQQMTASYQPNFTNGLIVLTAGVDNVPGDMPVATLVSKLKKLSNPSHPVELIIVQIGDKGSFTAMKQVAAAGDGVAYQVTDPSQVGQVFFNAIGRRICENGGCSG
jgi:Ca-activated chloride channel family protein